MTPLYNSKKNSTFIVGALMCLSYLFLFSIPVASALTWNIDHTTVISNSTEFWITNLGSLGDVNISQFRADEPGKILSINDSWLDDLYVNVDGDTMTGDLGFSDAAIQNPNYIQFNTTWADGSAEGRLQWNIDDGTLEVGMPGGDVNLQIGQEMLVRATNKEGVDIMNCQAVFVSGASGSNIEIKTPIASNISEGPLTFGLATETITNNQKGYVTLIGLVRGCDTSAWSDGDVLYLSSTEEGNLTNIPPTAPNTKVIIGIVTNSNANDGIIATNPTVLQRIVTHSDVFPNALTNNSILQYVASNGRWEMTINPFFGNVTANEYSFDGIKLRNLSTNEYINGSVMGIMMTNPPNEELPHLYIQSGGQSQFSGLVRSWGVINEEVGFLNTTNRTDCGAYFDAIGEELKIDCNTTTTGADFFVSDDFQVVDEMWAKDTDGEWHFMTRELELLDELRDNTLLSKINTSIASGDNFTIANVEGEILIVNIDENNTFLDRTQDSIILTTGTNETPIFNHIYYEDAVNPVLTKATTEQSGKADVAELLMGENFDYGSIGGSANQDEFTRNVYRRFFDDGAIYKSGFDISVDVNNINISTGIMKIILNDFTIDNNHSTENLAIEIHSNGTFHQHENDIEGFDVYSNGVPIGNNKYFNLVCGIAATQDFDGRMYCIAQDEPSSEHTSTSSAENDNTYVQYFPNNDFLKKVYIPVARVVIKNAPGGAEIQILSNGDYYLDVRGRVTGAGSPPTPGVTSHPDLENLNFSTAGHIGFFGTDGSSIMQGNANIGGFNLTNVSNGLFDFVGIGTDIPTYSLDISNSIDIQARFTSTDSQAGTIYSNSIRDWHLVGDVSPDRFRILDSTASTFPFQIEGGSITGALYIANDERVGINIDNPLASLHVNQPTGSQTIFRLTNAGQGSSWDMFISNGNLFIENPSLEKDVFFRDLGNTITMQIDNSNNDVLVPNGDVIVDGNITSDFYFLGNGAHIGYNSTCTFIFYNQTGDVMSTQGCI